MDVNFSHKPDYFLFAQLLIRHIEGYIKKHPDANNAIFDLRDIYELFRHDLASTTTNLEGILNIADEIVVIADGKIVKQGTREEIMPEIMGTAAAVGVCSGFTGNDGKEDR